MLNTDDPQTLASLIRLKRIVSADKKPIVFWVGAGASLWAGYPSWESVAKRIRRVFASEVPIFNNDVAATALSSGDYPAVFECCKTADLARYNAFLVDTFAGQALQAALYQRFVNKVKDIEPHFILTTNVDLALEQSLSGIDVIERSDCERISSSVSEKRSFIAKLHGSISSVSSLIFSSSDYGELRTNDTFLVALKTLFDFATVVFLGYGVRDEYVLDLLRKNNAHHQLFGSGPHFVVTSSLSPRLDGLHRIAYSTSRDADHRASLHVLDLIQQAKATPAISDFEFPDLSDRETGIYISQFFPPGIHPTSQAAIFGTPENPLFGQVDIGVGFVDGELPDSVSRAFHDLLVGLLCFDKVFLPVDAIPKLNSALPLQFDALIDDGSIRFIHTSTEPAIVGTPGSSFGSVGTLSVRDGQSGESVQLGPSSETANAPPRTVESIIRKMIQPRPGFELAFEGQMRKILSLTTVIDEAKMSVVPALTRGSLMMPRVAGLLGLSDSVLPSEIPRWLTFPVLRLAHLVTTSIICAEVKLQAVRIPFGGNALINATFGLQASTEVADAAANYVVSGRLGANLGKLCVG